MAVLNVPIYFQRGDPYEDAAHADYDCGEECVSMILYACMGENLREDQIRVAMGHTGSDGPSARTAGDELMQFLTSKGCSAKNPPGAVSADAMKALVQKQVSAGYPVMVLGNYCFVDGTAYPHWVVVVGADQSSVWINDPWLGQQLPKSWDWFCRQYMGCAQVNQIVQVDKPVRGGKPRWSNLHGVAEGGMAVTSNQDGRLEVLVRGTDGQLYHQYQTATKQNWSGKWEPLGGKILGRILALQNQDGRIAIFARGTDKTLWHTYQVVANGGWSGWSALDQDPAKRIPIDDLFTGARNGHGALELFARRLSDGVLIHRAQLEAGGGWQEGAALDSTMRVEGALAVGVDHAGRVVVVARDGQGGAHSLVGRAPGDWSGSSWKPLGARHIDHLLTMSHAQDGRLIAFAHGPNKLLLHIWQTAPNNGWASEWSPLGGSIDDVLGVALNKHGRLEVFARGADNALWHLHQAAPGDWNGSRWESLGNRVADLLAIGTTQDGRLAVFIRDDKKQVQALVQTAPGQWRP